VSYVDSLAAYLGNLDGLVYSADTAEGNVFVDHMPSGPDRAVCVYSTPGPEADSKLPYDPAQFQIVVRGEADGSWAAATWSAIYAYLHGKRNVTLPGGVYLVYCLAAQSSPFRLGADENGRARYSGNYRTEILNATAERSA